MEKIEKVDLVVKHNSLVNATSDYKFSRNELKMICILVSNINNQNEKDFKEKHINITDLDVNEETNNHTYISSLCSSIMAKPFKINGSIYNWFTKLTPLENQGIIEYQFHEDLKPFLLELKNNFTMYHVNDILKLRSSYSIQVFELLKQYQGMQSKTRIISIQEFREILCIPNSYKNKDIRILLETIQKDLKENTQIEFRFEIEKLGRKFNKITFEIKDNYENINKQKKANKTKRSEGAKTLSQKLKALKIEDVEI